MSWFHTTMFDVEGLPPNEEGQPVFKMSYNYRTEPNLCYEVKGTARVRMAEHPYLATGQQWGPWHEIDEDTTYHLNEPASACEWQEGTSGAQPFRNKHEVYIEKGHVSLICMHDPAPTGAEQHAEGEYSAYGDLALTLGTPKYRAYLEELAPFEQMVDTLSLARAEGRTRLENYPEWRLYQDGLDAQRSLEAQMRRGLAERGQGREIIVAPWMQM